AAGGGGRRRARAGAAARGGVRARLGRGDEEGPAELAGLVARWTGGEPLRPIARLQTTRTVRHLLDSGGEVLAEVADDEVTGSLPDQNSGDTDAPGGPVAWQTATAWREGGIELGGGPAGLLDAAGRLLLGAGARPSPAASKLSLLLSTAGSQG